ncbi:60S acidic ribosomal protein P2-like [Dromiciops gliroides]|uniref:60S acidic ribosomal protein P2-like n=1 Tax=Dromiciops gliroides TaxID=33562 RepID=UPI001CC4F892|nr:60S acidic ribosomal protein P2-like [Dromiciops gliroides]
MHYVAAYLLAVLGGNNSPNSKDLKKVLDSVGIKADKECMKKVIGKLSSKNIEDVIAQGSSKLASMPSGGGAVAVAASAGSAAPAAAGVTPAAAEEKKEEKKEESEESDDDMGFGPFEQSP